MNFTYKQELFWFLSFHSTEQVPWRNPIYRCHGNTKNLLYLNVDFPPQLSRDWPMSRFIWFTADRRCRIFVNFIDHLKLVITRLGGDIQKAFKQYSNFLPAIEGCPKCFSPGFKKKTSAQGTRLY